MNKGVSLLIFAVMLLVAAPAVMGVTSTGHVKLLAVFQENGEFKGSPADVQLEIKEGSGRVFLETIPLAKVDTQISTRFAKEMACKFAELDCNSYDFFYTIKSPAGIVGGPSAGGAISALTVALLLDLDVDQDAAMTGTINSGELIGPVGSVKEKIEAAKEAKISKVLIPAVQATAKNGNDTDLVEFGKEIGVEVVPVATIGDAVGELTGTEFTYEDKDINVPESYVSIMKEVSKKLCDRSEQLISEVNVFNLEGKASIDFELVQMQVGAQNLTEKGKEAFDEENHYSAASYCFGANVKANQLLYTIKNLTEEEMNEEAAELQKKIEDFDKITERRQKDTITDLQTYMIVKERILEAQQYLDAGENDSNSLGYVTERLNSAIAWSDFFGEGGEEFMLDEESLKGSCEELLGEVDERFQYLNLFFPGLIEDLKNNLLTAHQHYNSEEYALCIYLASKTKAEANILVTMLGVKEEVVDDVLQQKILSSKKSVTKQIEKGIFPIIAYSYYEYSRSLQADNNYAALLYSEYALELSDIDIYFDKKETMSVSDIREGIKSYIPTIIFIWGLILGFLLGWLFIRRNKKESAAKRPKQSAVRRKQSRKIKKGRKKRTNLILR